MKRYFKNTKIMVFVLGMILGAGLIFHRTVIASPGHDEAGATEANTTVSTPNVGVETVTDSNTEALGATSLSWTGEVLSTADVQVYGAREGQIAEWKVRLGDNVKKGQILGRLTPPPASIELSMALAERSGALVRARAQAGATEKLVQEERNRLVLLQNALAESRDAGLVVAEKEALKNIQASYGATEEFISAESNRTASIQAAEAEVAQAEASLPLKRQEARAALERVAERFLGELTSFSASSVGQLDYYFSYNGRSYGAGNDSSRSQYITSAKVLSSSLQEKNALPEAAALVYIQSAKLLLSNTVSNGDVSQSKLTELREILIDDEKEMLTTLKEFKEAQTDVSVKKADLEKIRAEQNREVVNAKTNALNAEVTVQSTESIKQKALADTRSEFVKQKSELDTKVSQLNRELTLAYAEVRAAEAGYGAIASGAGGQNIVAPQDGVVSAVFKNIGDHITPDVAIAGISSKNATTRFVRFRIPSDARIPTVDEEVKIERPGFPLTPLKAKVIGVGLALDQNGSYAADAEFIDVTDWPVHTSVRVIGKQLGQVVLAPLTAIWWNEKGVAQVWLVMENNVIRPQEVKVGRAIGDRIEIESGLNVNDRFVMKANSDLKTGQSITDLSGKASEITATQPAGEGDEKSHSE